MYPSLEEKVITRDNCYFHVGSCSRISDSLHYSKVRRFSGFRGGNKERKRRILAVLIVGQNYELQTLIKSCVYEARRLSLKQLKKHAKCGEIEPDNYVQITEGIIERLEKQCSEVKAGCSQKLLDSSICLYNHARRKGKVPCIQSMHMYDRWAPKPTTDQYLHALKEDNSEHKCPSSSKSFCPGLSEVSIHLTELKRTLETFP